MARTHSRSVRLTRASAGVLKMLAPYPWEGGHEQISFEDEGHRVRVSWQPSYDERILGQSDMRVGFSRADSLGIRAAIRDQGGEARVRAKPLFGPRPAEEIHFLTDRRGRTVAHEGWVRPHEAADLRREQHLMNESIRNADRKLQWHAKQGHTRSRAFSLTRHNPRSKYRGH